jgi:hypoxanthine phosphoribosyltransferase
MPDPLRGFQACPKKTRAISTGRIPVPPKKPATTRGISDSGVPGLNMTKATRLTGKSRKGVAKYSAPQCVPFPSPATPDLSSDHHVPPPWRREVDRVLITDVQIAARIREMSREIERDFRGHEMVVVSLLNGTVLFLADLIRHLSLPLRLDFIGVSSYGAGTTSGELVFTKELRLDVRGRDVLLVDDILDTGRTMKRVLGKLRKLSPRRIKTCVLLDKPSRRVERVRADYVGFKIPDLFVIGYGLDYAERYRNLPFVGVLKPEMYRV